MNTEEPLDFDDLGEALREGRALRPARGYRIRFAQDGLNFRDLDVADPVPLGRQILAAAGRDPHDGYSLFAILPSGDFEDVRLDEPFDLRERGAERFVAFQTDRDFKLTLNDHQLEWGKPAIGGVILYTLANIGEDEAVFLEVRGGEDRLIEPADLIDLTAPGIERFITAPRPPKTFEIIVKTPAREIRLIDGDEFLQHNAFRAPGAPSIEELREAPKKVDYLKGIYSRMRRGIIAHAEALSADNLHLLDGITFAFLSMDAGEEKRLVVEKLETLGVPFVDVGMGLELDEGSLGGILRVTTSTPEKRDHVHQGRISFVGGGEKDIYASNIQVADLNALNAVLAVVKWKKLRGFYRDLEQEHHCTYTTDGNMLLNGDVP